MNMNVAMKSLAVSALQQSALSALHSVDVTVVGEIVVLTGKVSSYYSKQLAQEAVRTVIRESEIQNNIRVVKLKHVGQ